MKPNSEKTDAVSEGGGRLFEEGAALLKNKNLSNI